MRSLLIVLSFFGLVLTLLPSFLVYHEVIAFDTHKMLTLLGTVLWLSTAPWWMNQKSAGSAESS